MIELNFKREIHSPSLENLVSDLTEALKMQGFGVLTRIDFHTKMKEKLNKDIRPTVILGACHPQMAYEAFLRNPNVTSLIPCNATIRELSQNKYSVELTKPSALMNILGESELEAMAKSADASLMSVLENWK